ncbi:MAG: DUF1559 domain-containing protein [Pirellulales bacterium]
MNNLKQIALGMHNYAAANRTFPPAVVLGPDGKTPHSWRIALLPYLEHQALYQMYKLDEPWDSENNKKVAATIPSVYRSPGVPAGNTTTSYVLPTNAKGMFTADAKKSGPEMRQIVDGLSNTVMILETDTGIPWTKPEDLPIEDGKLPKLGAAGQKTFNAAFADGSVRALPVDLDAKTFWQLIQIGDGESIDQSKFK